MSRRVQTGINRWRNEAKTARVRRHRPGLIVRLRALTGSSLALDRRFIVSPIRSSTPHRSGRSPFTHDYEEGYAGLTCRCPVIGGDTPFSHSSAPHPWDRYGEEPKRRNPM
jgi:hypothetical protein